MAKRRKVGRPKKPTGTGSVSISLRINEPLLKRLERAARDRGHGNLSREIQNRLRTSFALDGRRSEETKAIGFLLDETLGAMDDIAPADKALKDDRWRMLALAEAARALIRNLAPEGDVIPPKVWNAPPKDKNPEHNGEIIGHLINVCLIMGPAEHAKTPGDAIVMDYGWSEAREAFGVPLNPGQVKWRDLGALFERVKNDKALLKRFTETR
jgi:hypothetical protein